MKVERAKGVVRKHPACMFMEGFIAGWTNGSLGTDYEFNEVACIAKGDDHCSFTSAPRGKKRPATTD